MHIKTKSLLLFGLLLVLLAVAAPASLAQEPLLLKVNGDQVHDPQLVLTEGISFIPVETFARFSGAGLEWHSPEEFSLSRAGTSLRLTVGKNIAEVGSATVALPRPPFRTGETVFVPLRLVATMQGYDVNWEAASQTALLTRTETRDGMSPSELLVKSNQRIQAVNTYAMDGLMDMQMRMAADGQSLPEGPMNMKIALSGTVQYQPMQVHLLETISAAGIPTGPDAMQIELYMTEEKMYMKVPGQGWVVQPVPFPAEFWKQQQDIQSDPLKAMKQLEEMGILLNFGDDTQLNDQQYYVVNASLDKEKFQKVFADMFSQFTPGLSGAGTVPDFSSIIQKLFEKAQMDYYYTVYINQSTLLSDQINFRLDLGLDINPADFEMNGSSQPDVPKNIGLDLKLNGKFAIKDIGRPFVAPDVSTAQPAPAPALS